MNSEPLLEVTWEGTLCLENVHNEELGKLRGGNGVVKSRSSPGQSLDEFWIKGTRTEEQRLA